MTSLLKRRDAQPLGWSVAAVAVCGVLGLVAGLSPTYAIAAVLAIAFVLAVFADLALGVAIFAALSFIDQLASGGPALSLDKVIGLLLIVSWAARRSTDAASDARTLIADHPRLVAWIIAFLGWSAISVAWATSAGVALTTVYREVLIVLLIPVIYGAVNSRRDVYLIVAGFLIGAIVSAIYGILNPPSATAAAAGRLVSTAGDPNETAAALVAAIGLASGLGVVARRSARLRMLAIVCVVLALVGLVQTLSRSGLVAFAAMLVAGTIFGGPWRRPARFLLIIGAILIGGWFALLAPASSVKRVTNSNSDGRSDIWRVGWRMFEANPVGGVGAGNFANSSRNYLQRPGLVTAAGFIIVTPKVAHNIYLEALATLGIPGLILTCAVLFSGIIAALRAAHIYERLGDFELSLVSRACILGTFAYLASDFFISDLLEKQFWVIFGLSLALLKLARTATAQIEPPQLGIVKREPSPLDDWYSAVAD